MTKQPRTLRICLFVATVVIELTSPLATAQEPLPNGVAAGDVEQRRAVIWARASTSGDVLFQWSTQPGFEPLAGTQTVAVADPMIPAKVFLEELEPGTAYFYRATDAAGASSQGTFRTPFEEGAHGLRFGVSGDWRGELRPYPSISNMPQRDLDFFAALGDTVYADVPSIDLPIAQARTLEEFRIKHHEVYRERFGINSWAEARASTSLMVVLDDHEVTNDFSGAASPETDDRFDTGPALISETQLFRNGIQVLHEYNPIREEIYTDTGDPRTDGKPKFYRYVRYGHDAAVFLIDARTFRDPPIAEAANPFQAADAQAFQEASFDPTRTMLGPVQLADLMADLLDAQQRGIVWKFVLFPEPIQLFGPTLAEDRFEGYAYERTQLLRFIDLQSINNVVFIVADIHASIVNNLTYQRFPGDRVFSIPSFEITTGPVAYAEPLGPTVLNVFLMGDLGRALFSLTEHWNRAARDKFITFLSGAVLQLFGYDPIGLEHSPIRATLLEGSYLSAHTFGWTEFEIDADTRDLLVTSWGIDSYRFEDWLEIPDQLFARTPEPVTRFLVKPQIIRDTASPEADGPMAGQDVPDSPGSMQQPTRAPARSACGALGAVGWLLPLSLTATCTLRRFHFRR